ncbi:HNH endonuclease signature motif containing protein [Ruania albidiflava]|uniref:HNH endonuclease signature motif containing protein n=1 Tax=Ruania albidiflava TaxID=366586 RepID=UPI0003B32C5F|nr:HNH endonuclease signature motif containing protein [Ruania albidiflava]
MAGAQEEAQADRTACCDGVVIPTTLDLDQLRGVVPGTFSDGTPVPHGQLVKLLCDGELHRVVFGPEGQVLDSGRTERLFTPAQARAIIARDGCCQYPGCAAPPGIGEIHHCLWWYHGGRTSTDNGILLTAATRVRRGAGTTGAGGRDTPGGHGTSATGAGRVDNRPSDRISPRRRL